jgi:sugar lactone lactonase YvrE
MLLVRPSPHRARRRGGPPGWAGACPAEQSCLYVADLTNNVIYVLSRKNLQELDRIGREGRQLGEFHWVHAVSIDSQGNLYTGEVDNGSRIQKFLRYGDKTGCAGTGATEVGKYR